MNSKWDNIKRRPRRSARERVEQEKNIFLWRSEQFFFLVSFSLLFYLICAIIICSHQTICFLSSKQKSVKVFRMCAKEKSDDHGDHKKRVENQNHWGKERRFEFFPASLLTVKDLLRFFIYQTSGDEDFLCVRKTRKKFYSTIHFSHVLLFYLITGATVVSWRVNNQEQLFVR